MKILKIVLLVHKDLVPPKKFLSKKKWEESQCKTEFDVWNTLCELGHKVQIVPVLDDLSVIRKAIEEFKPHIAFNLLEEFSGQVLYEQNVVSYLQLMGLKYTGSNPKGLILSRDKGLAKKLLVYHGIQTPQFRVFPLDKKGDFSKLDYPLFVKSLNQEASLGIAQNSIVKNEQALRERVDFLHEYYSVDVLVERYIEGRELYVSLIGNRRIKTFPIWELYFQSDTFQGPKISTYKVKWDLNYRDKYGITTGVAQPIPTTVEKQIFEICKQAYLALSISGYARMDLRLTDNNEVFFIEANPNPDIGYKEDFSDSISKAGIGYKELIEQILRLGLE